MTHIIQSVFAYLPRAALTFGILALAPIVIAGDALPKKSPPPSRLSAEIDRLRALDPTERLKFVEKLAGEKRAFRAVLRGDLVVAVVERGSIEAANYFELNCNVKARDGAVATTIKWLVEDGTFVKKGDRLALLDDSGLRDQLQTSRVKSQEAEAAMVRATDNVRVTKRDNEVDVRLAEIALRLAEIELKDPPAGQSKQVLELKVEQAKLRLERAQSRAKAKLIQVEAEKRARTAVREQEAQRQRELEGELKHCELNAPADGFAVYHVQSSNRFGGATALIAQGEPVREGQKLLRVVDLKKFVVDTRIREALISSVRIGQPTQVRVDAFPEKMLNGKVTQVATGASSPEWKATDMKVYPVTVGLADSPLGLKPGMSAEVRIVTGERKNVLQVPLHAVWNVGKDKFCFIKVGRELLERTVITGASNADSVEIKEGLKEDDLVIANLPTLLPRP